MTEGSTADGVDRTDDTPSLGTIIAVLAAVSMFFATLEFLIPKPVPFLRIGLANIPILLVIHTFKAKHVLGLTLAKVIGQGLINGTLASYVFLFSFFGSFSSVLLMLLVSRLGDSRVSLVGISVAGALVSNLVQVSLSVTFIFGSPSWVIAPPFLILGTIAGVLVGATAEYFGSISRWVERLVTDYLRTVEDGTRSGGGL